MFGVVWAELKGVEDPGSERVGDIWWCRNGSYLVRFVTPDRSNRNERADWSGIVCTHKTGIEASRHPVPVIDHLETRVEGARACYPIQRPLAAFY